LAVRRRGVRCTASMREDIVFRPAQKIELRPYRHEIEAGARETLAPFAIEHLIEPRLELMQVEHILGGILLLRVAQDMGAPIGALLLLVELDAEQLIDEVLETVAVGIGAGELGGDLGAVERSRIDTQIVLERGDVETREMEDLEDLAILQQGFEAGRLVARPIELDQMGIAVARRQL